MLSKRNRITVYKDTVMLGKVFREKEINLIYGESGSGKTVSSIKALNNEGIEPILLDFDNNDSPEENNCLYVHVDGIKYIKAESKNIPTNKVVIIDTWQMFLSNGGSIKDIQKIIDNNNTVIVVAHNKPIATKQDIPDIDHKFANHFGSKLWLERKILKSTVHYNLHILKCRGYKGKPVISNWERKE